MDPVDRIARVRERLDEADAGGYGVGAWYFYQDRRDIEVALTQAEKVPALEAKIRDLEATSSSTPPPPTPPGETPPWQTEWYRPLRSRLFSNVR